MKLYHFTKAEIAIKKILPGMELRMNYLSNMNDPTENLCHIVNFDGNITFNMEEDFSFDKYGIAEKIRNETRIVAFSTDKSQSANPKIPVYGYQFQRMWATYGQNHEGICLVLDYEKFKTENAELIKKHEIVDNKVKYDSLAYREIPSLQRVLDPEKLKKEKSKTLNENWQDLKKNESFRRTMLFTKNADWGEESEYRFLTFSKDSNEILMSIKDSLSMVICGINFSIYYKPSLIDLFPKDEIYGIRLYGGDFGIERIIS